MIIPPLLTKGNKIAIVAPAGKIDRSSLNKAQETLSGWGLNVTLGSHVYDQYHYFAGKDADRLSDLQIALDDPEVSAILFARGGYGTTRILDQIDFSAFMKAPKWLIGFSDITAIHLKLQILGVASIHGPMANSFAQKGAATAIEALRTLLFKGESVLTSSTNNQTSVVVEAELTGGNLALIVDSLGTANEINTVNKILFIEEVGEKTYRLDRMFRQLQRAGKLTNLSGLVLGHFSLIDDGETPFGIPWQEVVTSLVNDTSFPVIFGFNIGHEPENMPVVYGGKYKLSIQKGRQTLELVLPD